MCKTHGVFFLCLDMRVLGFASGNVFMAQLLLLKKKAGFKLSVPQIVKHKSHHQHTIHWKPIIYNSVVDEHKLSWHQVSPR